LTALFAGTATVLLLTGCSLLTQVPTPDQTQDPPAPTGEPGGAPAGWETLTHCDGAPEDPWVWVEGFPADEYDSTGATFDCGDTWLQDDGENFVNVTDYEMTVDEIDAFGAALEASGYEKLFDNFIPGTPSGEDYYGARDYYLNGDYEDDFTRVAIEIYPSHTAADQWTAYIDYLSPETRQL
jgi:hypothetical protein